MQKFIKVAGRLVRMDHIVEVTDDGWMLLSTGTVISVNAADTPILQAVLAEQFGLLVTIYAAPQPVPQEEEIFHDVKH